MSAAAVNAAGGIDATTGDGYPIRVPAPITPFADALAGPVKRSITIAGHQTSISLEPVFWGALEEAARRRALPLSALVAEIDARRVAQREAPNLASALRSWLLIEVATHSQ